MPEPIDMTTPPYTENSDPVILSQEVKEIISYKPVWIVRNGILVLLIIFCLLISGTFFISYPDIITTKAKLYLGDSTPKYFAKINIGENYFTKIKKGQKVLLKFYAYPFSEYGTVPGLVDSICSTPTDSGYTARVMLPQGLMTSFNRQLQFSPQLTAEAGIVTEKRKLSDRLFIQIKHLTNK